MDGGKSSILLLDFDGFFTTSNVTLLTESTLKQ